MISMKIRKSNPKARRALEQGTDVLLPKMCSVLDTGHVRNGNKRRKTMYHSKNQ